MDLFTVVAILVVISFVLFVRRGKQPDKPSFRLSDNPEPWRYSPPPTYTPPPPEPDWPDEPKWAEPLRLMNKPETKIYYDLVRKLPKGYLLNAQVAVNRVVKVDDEHWKWAGGKSFDFLITQKDGYPAAVIEYHGGGHSLSENYAESDYRKKFLLDMAGIELFVVADGEWNDSAAEEINNFLACRKAEDDF